MNANEASKKSKIIIQSDWDEDLYAVKISVIDNGSGIIESHKGSLFEPLDNKIFTQGKGMSLSICKSIINFLGTDLWLEKSSTLK
jgi:signal transduction histidine kinase